MKPKLKHLVQLATSPRRSALVCGGILILTLSWVSPALAVGEATTETAALSLGKGADAAARSEAAEFSYLSDAAKGSSYGIKAALIWSPSAIFSKSKKQTWQWDLALGLNRNTISGDKRVDKLVGALGGRLNIDLNPDSKLQANGAIEQRRNRLTKGDETVISALIFVNKESWKPKGPLMDGAFGYDAKPFPFVGLYRTSTSGNTGGSALNGHFGAPVVGVDFSAGLFKDGVKGRWIALDVSVRRQFERWVGGDFKRANYDFGSAGLKLPFDTGFGGLGAISLVHSRGTDRVAGEPWKRQTELKLTLKFGST
jgi:hypothetical protein